MKTKLTLFVTVLAVALFGTGCATANLKGLSDSELIQLANNDNAGAQNEMGNRLRSDNADDNAKAAMWYTKAANQGHADAQNNLGELIDTGYAGAKDNDVLAQAWFIIASMNGSAKGKKNSIEHPKVETGAQGPKAKAIAVDMIQKNPKLLKK